MKTLIIIILLVLKMVCLYKLQYVALDKIMMTNIFIFKRLKLNILIVLSGPDGRSQWLAGPAKWKKENAISKKNKDLFLYNNKI